MRAVQSFNLVKFSPVNTVWHSRWLEFSETPLEECQKFWHLERRFETVILAELDEELLRRRRRKEEGGGEEEEENKKKKSKLRKRFADYIRWTTGLQRLKKTLGRNIVCRDLYDCVRCLTCWQQKSSSPCPKLSFHILPTCHTNQQIIIQPSGSVVKGSALECLNCYFEAWRVSLRNMTTLWLYVDREWACVTKRDEQLAKVLPAKLCDGHASWF